jgi:HAD superfamily hydrolase (TIGR01458 family)
MTALVLLDLDGTLYQAGAPIPGATEAVERLRAANYTVRFCTNTDSQSTCALLERVRALGFDIREGELFTPVVAAHRVLAGNTSSRTLALVSAAVREELNSASTLLRYEASEQATHVVIGDFRDGLSYAALDAAFRAVRAGATLLALQTGRYLRAADGPHLDTGAIVAAIEYAAETEARVLGKPAPEFVKAAIEAYAKPRLLRFIRRFPQNLEEIATRRAK